jgi:large subunit ribosomal protein L6
MSRVGREPIKIDERVTVKITNGVIEVTGIKGNLQKKLPKELKVELKEGKLRLSRTSEEQKVRSLHGLWRSLLANMMKGVSEGFSRDLKLVGTGYRVKMAGEKLVINCGFSHPLEVKPAAGIKLAALDDETIRVSGADKEVVGQMAAGIRALKHPEPYKGKGICYQGEVVRRKAGKAGKVGVAAGKGGE